MLSSTITCDQYNFSVLCICPFSSDLGLKFTENYGDRDFIGLSGIEVLGSGGKTLQIDPSQLEVRGDHGYKDEALRS